MSLSGKRVLVTGASGFLGSNLVRRLLDEGARVYAFVRETSDLWRLGDLVSELEFLKSDLVNAPVVSDFLRKVDPHIIYHAAARGALSHHKNARDILASNVMGTYILLEAASAIDYERFVFIGGSTEYGAKAEPMKETDSLDPLTFYGATKAAADMLCRQHAIEHHRPIVTLRAFSIYGPWEGPTRLIPSAIRAGLEGAVLPLTRPGYSRDFVFVDDVVAACLKATVKSLEPGEVINIGGGEQHTNEEVVGILGDLLGREIEVETGAYPARANDKKFWVADNRKAREMLGWMPEHSLRQGLYKTVEWYLANRGLYERKPAGVGSA
ncbi:MAG: NAD-dependent epimerase/dehydratase family protein [Candidatus Aquicultorales bacterium]